MKNSAYMTTMFARPILTPGMSPSSGVMALSMKDSAMASANSRPDSATWRVLLFRMAFSP